MLAVNENFGQLLLLINAEKCCCQCILMPIIVHHYLLKIALVYDSFGYLLFVDNCCYWWIIAENCKGI